ncbi:MAG: hypothetical protein IBX68_10560 [Dehalococcoidia bacterium]|nr:hypothetical protein [Dehalococcoidia bacterium]
MTRLSGFQLLTWDLKPVFRHGEARGLIHNIAIAVMPEQGIREALSFEFSGFGQGFQ